MSLTTDRGGAGPRAREHRPRRHGGPVVLATFESGRFDAGASRLAVEAAADLQTPLVIAQVLEMKRGRRRARRTEESLPPALAATVRAAREHAGDVGVEVEALRVTGRRPVASLLGFVADRRPALVVLATDPAALRLVRRPTRRRYRQFVAALAAHASCLMWTAQTPAAGTAGA
jgi:hypothetical protein